MEFFFWYGFHDDRHFILKEILSTHSSGVEISNNCSLKNLRVRRRCKQRIEAQFLYNGLKEPESLKRWSLKSIEELHTTALPESAKFVLESHIRTLQFFLLEQKVIDQQLDELSHQPAHEVAIDALMTVPGVGFITAMAFHLEIYKPERFQREEEIASYLGLAPMVKHSGEKNPRGHLVPVGQTGIPQKAVVAVARKLAIILWRLSIEKRAYRLVA